MLQRINSALPGLYFAWAISVGLAVTWITPPWQNPDETEHFLRMVQIASGGLIGKRDSPGPGAVGGKVDAAVVRASGLFAVIKLHPERKDTPALENEAHTLNWSDRDAQAYFSNTAVYPPIFYLPGVLCLVFAKLASIPIVQSLLLVRTINVVVSATLTAIGLWLSRRTRLALLALAVLPMSVTLSTTAGQEGPMLASIALAVGWIDELVSGRREARPWEAVALTAILGCAGMTKPPNLFLLGLVPLFCRRRTVAYPAVAIALACAIGWFLLCLPIAFRLGVADPSAQMRWMLAHMDALPGLAVRTFDQTGYACVASFIGVLGWLDTWLPPWFYGIAEGVLVLAFASVASGQARLPGLALAVVLLCSAALFGGLYLITTPVGGAIVEGVQGRYFIPLAAVLSLAVPGWRWLGRWAEPWAVAAVLGLMAIVPAVMLRTLVLRYYFG